MKLCPSSVLFLLVFLPLTAAADDASQISHMMKPGLWEITIQIQMAGMPEGMPAMPPRTVQKCVTQAQLDKFHGVPTPDTKNGTKCSTDKINRKGKTLKYSMSCTSSESKMHIESVMTFESHNNYHGTTQLTGNIHGHDINMSQTIAGKRIGDCKGN